MKDKFIEFFMNIDRKIAISITLFITVFILMIAMLITEISEEAVVDTKIPEIKVENQVEPTQTPAVTPTPEPTVEPTPNREGLAQSRLTGEWIDEDLAAQRPYAVMFSNIKAASPQSGISQCEILIEAVVEGAITRIMGVSQYFTTDRIGSIRSARPYFVGFCKDFDAIYVHMGGSTDAKNLVKTLSIADLDGTGGIGNSMIYRDSSISAPHNAFTSASRIEDAVSTKGFRMDYQGLKDNHFKFNEESVEPESTKTANKVTVKMSSYTSPYFVYDPGTKLYGRYQFGTQHIDYNSKKQLQFTNIIIMYVKQWSIDSQDRQAMDINNSTGNGVYISNGKAVDIKWSRNQSQLKMQFLTESGELLSINPGKTFIEVVPTDMKSSTVIE